MKAAADQARARGDERLSQAERDAFVACYEELMAEGLPANPPPSPERPPAQKGRRKQSPARTPPERLWMDHEAVLAFLDDLTIPFDNNQVEQDLRLLKVQ